MPRFVILRHQMPPQSSRPDHWDLMLEDGSHLLTWALPAVPLVGEQFWALPLAEHRLEYLDYEGPLTGDRGRVTRHDWGNYKKLSDDNQQQIFMLRGQYMSSRVTIGKITKNAGEVELRIEPESCDSLSSPDR
ncbi:MAG: hypothetical protein OSA43_00835 [Pirellulales bacterium]|jgi:hypothetical protein|nr:hypothetical protein [Pirellulales bacterium]